MSKMYRRFSTHILHVDGPKANDAGKMTTPALMWSTHMRLRRRTPYSYEQILCVRAN